MEESSEKPAILVPVAAVRVISGSPRVYVVTGDRAEERDRDDGPDGGRPDRESLAA